MFPLATEPPNQAKNWLPLPYTLGPILPLSGGRPPRGEPERTNTLPGRTGRLKLGY